MKIADLWPCQASKLEHFAKISFPQKIHLKCLKDFRICYAFEYFPKTHTGIMIFISVKNLFYMRSILHLHNISCIKHFQKSPWLTISGGVSNSFMTKVLIIYCRAKNWTGFYIVGISVIKELNSISERFVSNFHFV